MRAFNFRRTLSSALVALLLVAAVPLVASPQVAEAALPPSNVSYYSVSFVDAQRGWAAGSSGTLIRTHNGGDNWEVLATGTTEAFVAVDFVDESQGWALTVKGRVYRTQNGGDTWTQVTTPRWRGILLSDSSLGSIAYDLNFVDENTGFLTARAYVPGTGSRVCGLVYKTSNGGLNWDIVLEGPDYKHPDDLYPEGNSVLRGIDFVSSSHGWVVGVDNQPAIPKSLVYRTTTGGGSKSAWTEAGTGITGSAELHAVSFANTQSGLAVGANGAVRKSTNGGATWTAKTSGTTNTLRDVFMLDTSNAWAVGDGGVIRRTVNGGESWTAGWAQTAIVPLYSLQVIGTSSALKGWLVGGSGRVRITTDGQNWWTPAPDVTGPAITGLSSATHPSQTTWYTDGSGPATFTWDQSTDISGVEGYSTSFSTDSAVVPDNTVDLSGATSTTYTHAGPLSDGTWYFRVKAKDGAGNWGGVATYTVKVDASAPSGSIVLNGGEPYTASAEAVLSSAIVFGPSGPASGGSMRISTDGGSTWGAWMPFEAEFDVTLPTGDGEKTVHAEFRDGAGNSATFDAGIVLDTAQPGIASIASDTHPSQSVWYSGSSVHLTWVGIETASGIAGYEYMWWPDTTTEPDAWSATLDDSVTLDAVPDGVWRFKVRARNNVGEWGPSRPYTVRVDTQPATGAIVVNSGERYTTAAEVEVRPVDVDFGPSGPNPGGAVRYSTNGGATWGAWAPLEPAVTLALPAGTGVKLIWAEFRDAAGNVSAPAKATIEVLGGVVPLAGASRWETAVLASAEAYPDGLDPAGARTVVIATGRNWPDALGGSALAGALDGPILLVNTTTVPDVVSAEVERLGAQKAVIVGGEFAVAPAVMTALEGIVGAGNVDRVSGTNRYATADAVALETIEVLEAGVGYDGTAFVATGGSYADAVAAAPLAAAKGWPLYLAHPTSGLRAATLDAMDDASDVLVLGGTAAVSEPTYALLEAKFGAAQVDRLAGANRYDTAAVIATHGVAEAGLAWNRVGIATGQAYPDALAGGVLQGKVGSVMLLTRSNVLNPEPYGALSLNRASISTVTYFGGLLAVGEDVRDQVELALGR